VLKEAGLITERRNGTQRLYAAGPQGLGELRAAIEAMWHENLRQVLLGDDNQPVGFLQVGTDLAEKYVRGDAHRTGEATACIRRRRVIARLESGRVRLSTRTIRPARRGNRDEAADSFEPARYGDPNAADAQIQRSVRRQMAEDPALVKGACRRQARVAAHACGDSNSVNL
jgi:hypothetical protein